MIKTKMQLKQCLSEEYRLYYSNDSKFENIITGDFRVDVYRYIKLLRLTEYHHNNNGVFHKLMYIIFRRRKNRLGLSLGLELWDNCFDTGLKICHAGNIVVNGGAKIGKNCRLHGCNCIGNNGKTLKCPQIGDNVHLGVGAKVLGDVTIADNITIAAGAVVIHSFTEPGITIGGIPARKIK